jgi:hypothetical protein
MIDESNLAAETRSALHDLFAFDGIEVSLPTKAAEMQALEDEIRALDDSAIRVWTDPNLAGYLVSNGDIKDLSLTVDEDGAVIGMSDVTFEGTLGFTWGERPSSLPVRIVRKDASNPEYPEFVISVDITR